MIILDTVNRKIEALLSAAAATTNPVATAHYVDMQAGTFTPASNNVALNGNTAVTVAAAPASGFQRQIKYISIYNGDTATVTLTLRYNDNGTLRTMWQGTLQINDTLQYVDNRGLVIIDTNGNIREGVINLLLPYDYAELQDQKSQNVAGGGFTQNIWQTRTLNTITADTGSNVTLSSNQFTLTAGTYRILARAPAHAVNSHQTRLRNITDSATTLTGTSADSDSAASTQTDSFIEGRFTITASKTFEIQHQCATTGATTGFGFPANIGTEVYTTVQLWKEPPSTKSSANGTMSQPYAINQFRLTLTSHTPITTSDVTAAGTLYLTPIGEESTLAATAGTAQINLPNGSSGGWYTLTSAEISTSLTLTSGKNYDVFVYNSGGAPALTLGSAWTNDSTRADALDVLDGIPVNHATLVSGSVASKSALWVGTIRASGTNTTESSLAKRFVWNTYNQTELRMVVQESTASWSGVVGIRQMNGNSANQVAAVTGVKTIIHVEVSSMWQSSNGFSGASGVGVNSTSTNSASIYNGGQHIDMASTWAYYKDYLFGYSPFMALEFVQTGLTGANSWYNTPGTYGGQSGIVGCLMG